jgi:hypothetical protein
LTAAAVLSLLTTLSLLALLALLTTLTLLAALALLALLTVLPLLTLLTGLLSRLLPAILIAAIIAPLQGIRLPALALSLSGLTFAFLILRQLLEPIPHCFDARQRLLGFAIVAAGTLPRLAAIALHGGLRFLELIAQFV